MPCEHPASTVISPIFYRCLSSQVAVKWRQTEVNFHSQAQQITWHLRGNDTCFYSAGSYACAVAPNVGFTLERDLAVFTRSAITSPRDTDLDEIKSTLSTLFGSSSGRFWARSAQWYWWIFCLINNARFRLVNCVRLSKPLFEMILLNFLKKWAHKRLSAWF